MSGPELRRLLFAPELVVVNLVDHAITALRLALLGEHPLIDDHRAVPEDPPVQRKARVLLRHALRLRRALDAYRREVDHVLGLHADDDDMPF
jgi:hypothetical protein